MIDTRVVYGAGCVWWGAIGDVAAKPSGLPCCPHCGGMLFEVADEAEWWASARRHAQAQGDPNYPEFLEWLRSAGRCFPRYHEARDAWLMAS
jgi:hypothetical protein